MIGLTKEYCRDWFYKGNITEIGLTKEIFAVSLTAGSTGIVLVTLSGETREYGIWLTVGSFICHMVGDSFCHHFCVPAVHPPFYRSGK